MKTNLQKKMANLFRALKSNKSAKVRKILVKNPELVNHPECVEKNRSSPLWTAMLQGNNKIVELLVRDFGADPDEKCRIKNLYLEDRTFFMYAVTVNDELKTEILKVAEILIKHGADINAKLHDKTLLEVAVTEGHLKFVELLLKSGAKLPSESDGHHSLVSHVFRKSVNRKDLLLLLLEYGLDTGYLNYFGENQLHIFIRDHGDTDDEDAVDIAKILIDQPSNGISIDGADKNNMSPLMYAVDVPHVLLISFFIKYGADVNRKTYDGKTSLQSAVVLGNLDVVELLLENGADINAKCSFNWSIMHEACVNANEELIKFLIRKGADISVENQNSLTPFSFLHVGDVSHDDSKRLMIREFCKLKFDNISICKLDMQLLQDKPLNQDYFQKSLTELERMSNSKFYAPFSYYSVLKMKNIKKLAYLTKNEEFVANFEAGLSSFSCYKNDLREVLEEAVKVKDVMEIVELRVKNIFGDFLPKTVIRKLVDNLILEDLPFF